MKNDNSLIATKQIHMNNARMMTAAMSANNAQKSSQ